MVPSLLCTCTGTCTSIWLIIRIIVGINYKANNLCPVSMHVMNTTGKYMIIASTVYFFSDLSTINGTYIII